MRVRGSSMPSHRVDRLGDDRAVVRAWAARHPAAPWREQAVLAHQPQDAPLGGAGAGVAQPCPHLTMPLAVEGTGGQYGPDRLQEVGIGQRFPS